MDKCVLIDPCWMLLVVEAILVLRFEIVVGPIFFSQLKSIIWLAIFCPNSKLILGMKRWTIDGK